MKTILFTIALLFLLPALNVFAVTLTSQPVTYENNTTYTLELKAQPMTAENAVKLNIVVTGGVIEDYLLYNESNWLAITSDCSNNKTFTQNSICTTLIKSTLIKKDESLGFITLKVTDANKLSIYKLTDTEYSDGTAIRGDVGELIVRNTQIIANNQIPTAVYGSEDPLSFYLIIGLALVIIIIVAAIVISFFKPASKQNI